MLDASQWIGIVGTVVGAFLGFGLSVWKSRLEESKAADNEAAVAAFSCLERLRSFRKRASRTVDEQDLDALEADAQIYRASMLQSAKTRRLHGAAYDALRDYLSGPDADYLPETIDKLSKACSLD